MPNHSLQNLGILPGANQYIDLKSRRCRFSNGLPPDLIATPVDRTSSEMAKEIVNEVQSRETKPQ
jgi:hypothetical protein